MSSSICTYVKSFFWHKIVWKFTTWYLHEILLCMMKMRLWSSIKSNKREFIIFLPDVQNITSGFILAGFRGAQGHSPGRCSIKKFRCETPPTSKVIETERSASLVMAYLLSSHIQKYYRKFSAFLVITEVCAFFALHFTKFVFCSHAVWMGGQRGATGVVGRGGAPMLFEPII